MESPLGRFEENALELHKYLVSFHQNNFIRYLPIIMKTSFIYTFSLGITFVLGSSSAIFAQQAPASSLHSETLHTAKPDYPVRYDGTNKEDIMKVLNRVYGYLDAVTPPKVVNKQSGEAITDYTKIDANAVVYRGDFSLTSYEWGVTYSGMLRVGEVTGDTRFTNYTAQRLQFIADVAPFFRAQLKDNPQVSLRQVLTPHALDDCGAVCVAMIKASRAGVVKADLRPLIDNYMDYISNKEFRLTDGTLARNRPLPNTIWLDDLFMGVPSLAYMGKLTGDKKYYDDAVKQVLQFSRRMFNRELKLFMHGWVQDMGEHPEFHWARANGWAILTMVELLDVLPADHIGRPAILNLLKSHAKGLAAQQTGMGFWHQLLDKQDSYLETSATAIYTYAIAHAINQGWLDATAYGPMVLLGWNAVATKVTDKGQVEGTCVGTGMAFDPAFYYYRPINVYAAHGYGPVLLAGAEVIELLKNKKFALNDSAIMLSK